MVQRDLSKGSLLAESIPLQRRASWLAGPRATHHSPVDDAERTAEMGHGLLQFVVRMTYGAAAHGHDQNRDRDRRSPFRHAAPDSLPSA